MDQQSCCDLCRRTSALVIPRMPASSLPAKFLALLFSRFQSCGGARGNAKREMTARFTDDERTCRAPTHCSWCTGQASTVGAEVPFQPSWRPTGFLNEEKSRSHTYSQHVEPDTTMRIVCLQRRLRLSAKTREGAKRTKRLDYQAAFSLCGNTRRRGGGVVLRQPPRQGGEGASLSVLGKSMV